MNEKELKAHLKTKEYATLYLFVGDEDYLKQAYCRKIISDVVDEGMEEFNFNRFDAKSSIFEIINTALQFPMMSEKRCVFVDDFKFESMDDESLAYLEQNAGNLPESTVLIFRQSSDIPKKGNGKKGIEVFEKCGLVCELNKRTGSDLYNPLISMAKKQDCILSRELARYLVEQVGDDFNVLVNELQKVCGYCGCGEIKKSHIDEIATKTLETKTWFLTDNLISGNFEKAFEAYDILVKQKTEPEYLLGIISSTFVDMYRVKICEANGAQLSELSSAFGYKREFVLLKAKKNASKYSADQLRKCIQYLSEADMKLKSGARDNPYLIIEQLMIKLTMVKNG